MCESNCKSEDEFKVGDRVVLAYIAVGDLGDPDVVGVVKEVRKDTVYFVDFPYGEEGCDAEELVAMPVFEAPKDETLDDIENLRTAIKVCRIIEMPEDLIVNILIESEGANPGLAPLIPALREELGLPAVGVAIEDVEKAVGPEAVAQADAIEAIFAEVFGPDIFASPEPIF